MAKQQVNTTKVDIEVDIKVNIKADIKVDIKVNLKGDFKGGFRRTPKGVPRRASKEIKSVKRYKFNDSRDGDIISIFYVLFPFMPELIKA